MPLDPQAAQFLEAFAAVGMDADALKDPAGLRARMALMPRPEPVPCRSVEDRAIPAAHGSIPVRIYRPSAEGTLPALVYFHGGGWVIGDLDGSDNNCRLMAEQSGHVVVSVDYRLAPEAKFPAASDDCYTATKWVAENAASLGIDPTRIAVGGDSAGGHLAAVVSLMARDQGGPSVAFQLLIYPVTDYRFDTGSYQANANGYLLSKDMMVAFWDHYLNSPADADNPIASPLRAKDLSNLPPALVITAEFDPLRDEGEAYALRLKEAGNRVELTRYDGMIHGFFGNPVLDQGMAALAQASKALAAAAKS